MPMPMRRSFGFALGALALGASPGRIEIFFVAAETGASHPNPTISEIVSGVSEFKGAVSEWMEVGIKTLKEGTHFKKNKY